MDAKPKRPILKDVAARAGVSLITASVALRPRREGEGREFSEETGRRVLEAARELGYVPHRSARAMVTSQTGVIGFAAANLSKENEVVNFSVYPFVIGLSHYLGSTGRHVAHVELKELETKIDAKSLPDSLNERYFDGLVVHYGLSPKALSLLEGLKIPVICWDSGLTLRNNCIYRDEFAVGTGVAEHLLDLGHTRLAYLPGHRAEWQRYQRGEATHYSYAARHEGLATALKKRKLKLHVLPGYDYKQHGAEVRRRGITALITQSGSLPAFKVASAARLQVPDELSVVSCDVESSTFAAWESIGGAGYNRYEAGQAAGRLLVKRLERNGESVPSVVLPFELHRGELTAPPAA